MGPAGEGASIGSDRGIWEGVVAAVALGSVCVHVQRFMHGA